jgi:hypothetical protein
MSIRIVISLTKDKYAAHYWAKNTICTTHSMHRHIYIDRTITRFHPCCINTPHGNPDATATWPNGIDTHSDGCADDQQSCR